SHVLDRHISGEFDFPRVYFVRLSAAIADPGTPLRQAREEGRNAQNGLFCRGGVQRRTISCAKATVYSGVELSQGSARNHDCFGRIDRRYRGGGARLRGGRRETRQNSAQRKSGGAELRHRANKRRINRIFGCPAGVAPGLSAASGK